MCVILRAGRIAGGRRRNKEPGTKNGGDWGSEAVCRRVSCEIWNYPFFSQKLLTESQTKDYVMAGDSAIRFLRGTPVIKPIWATVGGLALLGTAGGVGVLIARTGGEEEVAQQVATAVPTASTQASSSPSFAAATPAPSTLFGTCDLASAPEGTELWRWGDVTLLLPQHSDIRAAGSFDGPDQRPAIHVPAGGGWGFTVIDAATGAIIRQDPKGDFAEQIDAIVRTTAVCPFDPVAAPWPYNGEPPDAPRNSYGNLTYLEPDPVTGVQVQVGIAGGQGSGGAHSVAFLEVKSARSAAYVDAATGELMSRSRIASEDDEAFKSFLAEIQVRSP